MTLPALYAFTKAHLLSSGQILPQDIYFSPDTGLITPNYTRNRPDINVTKIDLEGECFVAPGFLELQINGGWGVHFSTLGKAGEGNEGDEERLKMVARELVKCGVTGWWATVPTVEEGRWKEILPHLRPRSFDNSSSLLGAHVEGPYLHPTKKGAHDASHFYNPSEKPPTDLYGAENLKTVIKLITLAPEIPGALDTIRHLRTHYPQISISLGHSTATYSQGQEALRAGAKGITHLFNAMNPLHHPDPGLAGLTSNNTSSDKPQELLASPTQQLLSSTTSVQNWLARQLASLDPSSSQSTTSKPECYYSIIPDLIHLHPSVLSIAFRTSPQKCMLITDAIELAGLPDGIYPPNDQVSSYQVKKGNKATIQNTETLIGSCITLDQCVRNMVEHAGCTLAEAVRCVTENVAGFMGESARGRGRLDVGCRADFVVLDRQGVVKQTWIGGVKVWDVDEADA